VTILVCSFNWKELKTPHLTLEQLRQLDSETVRGPTIFYFTASSTTYWVMSSGSPNSKGLHVPWEEIRLFQVGLECSLVTSKDHLMMADIAFKMAVATIAFKMIVKTILRRVISKDHLMKMQGSQHSVIRRVQASIKDKSRSSRAPPKIRQRQLSLYH
jgi:hypothetical protein